MNQFPLFVGIDVSKERLDVAVRPTGEAWQVSHDSRGINDLVERLGELAPQLVVLEATGGMEMALAGELAASKLAVAVVNPRHVRDFARAAGKLAKTDAWTPRCWPTLPRRCARTPDPCPMPPLKN